MGNTRNRTICLPPDIDDHIRESGINISKWVADKYRHSFMIIDALRAKIRKKEVEIAKMRANLANQEKWLSRKKAEEEAFLPKKEAIFFKEAIPKIRRNPSFIDGQIKLYINKFQKRITKKEFLKKLNKIKKIKKVGGDIPA